MGRLLKEPLLHFLLLGALLFVAFELKNRGDDGPSDKRIVVGEGRIAQLVAVFTKTWQRAPTRQELQGLIDDFVLEEIYYRQAVEMGLDRNDTVIRRRMRQKIEFLTDDAAALVQPGDDELAAYLAANAERFRSDNRYTFRQVYIIPERHAADLDQFVAESLATLRQGGSVAGASGLLPEDHSDSPARAVDSTFGTGFSRRLDKLTPGEWRGPVKSGLGLHLVRLESRTEGAVPELAGIRKELEREWANEKRLDTRRQLNEKLRQDYEVVIEWPEQSVEDPVTN